MGVLAALGAFAASSTGVGLSAAAGLAGAAVSGASAIVQGESTAAQDKYQAQVAANNATTATQNAQLAAATGEAQAGQQETKNRAVEGSIVAAQGANNITIGTGSALDVEQSSALTGQIDAATIRSNAARVAYGYETQAQDYQAESNLENQASSNSALSGFISGTGSLLGGAASVGSKYAGWQATGGSSGTATF